MNVNYIVAGYLHFSTVRATRTHGGVTEQQDKGLLPRTPVNEKNRYDE